jgi:hypothetical protein
MPINRCKGYFRSCLTTKCTKATLRQIAPFIVSRDAPKRLAVAQDAFSPISALLVSSEGQRFCTSFLSALCTSFRRLTPDVFVSMPSAARLGHWRKLPANQVMPRALSTRIAPWARADAMPKPFRIDPSHGRARDVPHLRDRGRDAIAANNRENLRGRQSRLFQRANAN